MITHTPALEKLEEMLYPILEVSREVKPGPYIDKFFEKICEAKKTTLSLECSPKLIALLTGARECKHQEEGKLELLVACCKVVCYINFELTDYNFQDKIL